MRVQKKEQLKRMCMWIKRDESRCLWFCVCVPLCVTARRRELAVWDGWLCAGEGVVNRRCVCVCVCVLLSVGRSVLKMGLLCQRFIIFELKTPPSALLSLVLSLFWQCFFNFSFNKNEPVSPSACQKPLLP